MNGKLIGKIAAGMGCLTVIGVVVLLGPGILLGIALSAGAERTIYERAVSPDGRHDARVQFDDAGAVSSFSRLVFVKHHWNHSDEPLLSCRAFWAEGEAPVHLRWLDNRTLLIQHGFTVGNVEATAGHCGPIRIEIEGPAGRASEH